MRASGLLTAILVSAAVALPAHAAPRVATDIPPVHALVARVMEGIGAPELLLPPGASPHGYAMRPSEVALLQEADLVLWVGPELTPWLERAVDNLTTGAVSVALLDTHGVVRLEFREGATFEAHERDHADADYAHADEHAHDDHAHAHGSVDPHAWLDPVNAQAWLGTIATALAGVDPANADTYVANAAAGKTELEVLITEIRSDLAPLADRSFVVFHDAYHYFERRFGIEAAGAIALSDAAAPSPARVAEVRDAIHATKAACVFTEPQFEPALVATVTEGTDASVGELDPIGATLELGPGLYPTLISALRDGLADCLER